MSVLSLVPITAVRPDPRQPRTYFKDSALRQLAASIKAHGQRQPITVREREPGTKPRYEIIDGERRWRACQLAGIQSIRIDIESADLSRHATQHMLSLASNFMREGHTHMEVSNAIKYQVDAIVESGQSNRQAVQAIMEAVGKSEAWVYQYLQLQDLAPDLQELMHPETPDKTRLRFSEAVVLASLPAAKQKQVCRGMLRAKPGTRLELARRLAAEAMGQPRERRQGDIKGKTTRFIAKVSTEVERMLDYKDSDFTKALANVPAEELKEFRGSLAALLDIIDRASKARSR